MKNAYTDRALLLVLTRSLPQEFVSTIHTIDVQTSMRVEEKLQHLQAKDQQAKQLTHRMSRHRRNDSSSSNGTDINPGKCLLCD
ncbi:hypothetical protein GcM1_173002 [Golovinomyces cichoracearum]|uniref:Uncharacterized protein n=1 Tax=Golovinomyces cichoracearum TaxID=62708 RepID=A0A420J607_9PEZI|nr:hypothetical protein GcM1_173002 [Golovinomyces cichoracearum]